MRALQCSCRRLHRNGMTTVHSVTERLRGRARGLLSRVALPACSFLRCCLIWVRCRRCPVFQSSGSISVVPFLWFQFYGRMRLRSGTFLHMSSFSLSCLFVIINPKPSFSSRLQECVLGGCVRDANWRTGSSSEGACETALQVMRVIGCLKLFMPHVPLR